jgi:flagellar biogenesis protein FliO
MSFIIIFKLITAFLFVLGLIVLSAYLFSKVKDKNFFKSGLLNPQSINIVETKLIDSKQKLMIVKLQNTQYLVLLSPNGNIILDKIESNKELS